MRKVKIKSPSKYQNLFDKVRNHFESPKKKKVQSIASTPDKFDNIAVSQSTRKLLLESKKAL